MGSKAFTVRGIRTLPPGLHADGGQRGLYLAVSPSGARSWILRYQLRGRRRDMGLGSLEAVGLAEARELAADFRKLIRAGTDPLEAKRGQAASAARQAEVQRRTFETVARTVHETLAPGWKNAKHAAQWISTLEAYAFPLIGARPVADVGVAEVLEVLKPIWTSKAETARRVRQRLDAVMRYAVAHGFAPSNPVDAAVELLPRQRDEVQHHAALPVAEVPGFMATLAEGAASASRLALQFLVLTAARSGEVRGATWAEVDLEAARWTVPGERMKAGREHRVPLSPQALAVLEEARRQWGSDPTAPIFPGAKGKPLSDMALVQLMRGLKLDATPHGFRSSFRDWCSEQAVPSEVAERALAHAVKDQTEAAYLRADLYEQRRPVMVAWGAFAASKGAK